MNWLKKWTLQSLVLISITASAMDFPYYYPRSASLGGVQAVGFTDPASMLANPAAIVKIDQNSLVFLSGVRFSKQEFDTTGDYPSVDSGTKMSMMPALACGFHLGSRLAAMGVSAGIIDTTRFRFPATGPQRYQGSDLSLTTGSIDVAFGFIPYRTFAFGFKIGYLISDFEYKRNQNPFGTEPSNLLDYDTRWTIKGTDDADLNAAIGFIWTPSYRFELGLTYRPPLAYHFRPDLTVTLPELMGGNSFQSEVENIYVAIPQEIVLGSHWIALERLDLYADVAFIHNAQIDSIEFTMKSPKEPIIPEKFEIPIHLKNGFRINAGCEFLASSNLTIRAGSFYNSAIGDTDHETALLPLGTKYGITGGFGYKITRMVVDVAGGYVFSPERDATAIKTPFPLEGRSTFSESFLSIGFNWLF